MAAGVCVLTSDIPENKEAVEGAGYTFRKGDSADLQRMIDLLVHNPDLRQRAANRERERVESSYLWPDIARSIEATYYGILGWNDRLANQGHSTSQPPGNPLDRTPFVLPQR
jgi:glycosyltransferase involved in cell wall biosynthesis